MDRFWQAIDRYMPATIHSKKDAGVNPRVLIYFYSFVWRTQLKIDCDFRKQLGKVCRENVQRPKFQGSMILHCHFKKHKCKLLTFAGRLGLKLLSKNMLLAKTHAAFYIRVTSSGIHVIQA